MTTSPKLRFGIMCRDLHTLNRMGVAAVVDGKRFAFDPFAWRHNWRRLHEVFG